MLIELLGLLVVNGLDLVEEDLLFGWIVDCFVVIDEVGLPEQFQLVKDISLH